MEETRDKIIDHPTLGKFNATKVRDKARSLFETEAVENQPIPSPTEEESAEDRVQRLIQDEEVQSSIVSLLTRIS